MCFCRSYNTWGCGEVDCSYGYYNNYQYHNPTPNPKPKPRRTALQIIQRNSFYQTQDGEWILVKPAVKKVKSNMAKTEVEIEDVKADAAGIITKQSEVYVWNDQVFASYKSALAASKKSKIIEKFVEHIFTTPAGYTAAQRKSYVVQYSARPESLNVNAKIAMEALAELLVE